MIGRLNAGMRKPTFASLLGWHVTLQANFGTKDSFLGSVFGRTDFSRIFIFEPPDFVCRGFCRQISSPHFCGKKCPEKSSKKIPDKILQILYNKNPQQFSAEGPGQFFWGLRIFPRNVFELSFFGPKKIPQNSRQISHEISLPKIKKTIHRRASAGAQ